MDTYRITLIVLISIVAVGLVALPFGNPKFIDRAIIFGIIICYTISLSMERI